ncbi:MAG: GNAT family N-acetyltransferase [Desulfotalea sp.]
MQNISVVEAINSDFLEVSGLVQDLLIELEPSATEEIKNMKLDLVTKELFEHSKIWSFLAKYNDVSIGVINLHECASIYAGGVFGKISELYVKPDFRSSKIGHLLIRSAIEKGKKLGWKRLEVGSPPANESPRTIKFYEGKGFKCIGSRLRLLI